MTRSLSTLMTGTLLLSMVFSGSSMAQVDLRQRPTHPIGGAKEKMETQVDLQKNYPAWAPVKLRHSQSNNLRTTSINLKRTAQQTKSTALPGLLDTPAPTTLWGNVIYQKSWGDEETHYGFYSILS